MTDTAKILPSMESLVKTACAIFCVALIATSASAREPSHGFSYFGDLKYPQGFSHFDYANPDAPKGGTLKTSPVLGTFNNLHSYVDKGLPATYTDTRSVVFMYDRLMVKAEDELASYYGALAESVEVADDYSWVAYTLRQNAYWHDGAPVTVEDALWTFNKIKTEGSVFWKNSYREFDRIERTGTWSFKFHFRADAEKTPQLPVQTAGFIILPKHYWTEQDENGELKRLFTETTLESPLGNGPYRIAEVDPGHEIVFERVENYWGKDLNVNVGRHNFDRIEVLYFFDKNVHQQALKAGVFHYYRDQNEKDVATAYDFPAVDRGLFKKETYQMGMPMGMHWSIVFNTRHEKLKDIRVREALTLAYNFDWANRVFWHGGNNRNDSFFMGSDMAAVGLPSDMELELLGPFRDVIPPRVFTHEVPLPKNKAYGRNRETLLQADRLLEEAGWVIKDFRRVHEETGEPYTLDLVISLQEHERMLTPFVDSLKRLGIKATLRRVESNLMVNRLRRYDYDLTMRKFYQFKIPIPSWMRSNFLSRYVDVPNMGNLAGIDNAAVDFLVEKVIEATSEAELTAAGRALDRVLLWNFYVIPEGYPRGRHLVYWDRFGHPPLGAEHMNWTGFPHLWWHDAEKAARVDAGIAELQEK